MSTITTADDVLVFLGKASNATDAERGLLAMLLPLAEEKIRDYLGYTVTPQQSYTQYFPEKDLFIERRDDEIELVGNRVTFGRVGNINSIWLPELPVRSITSVHEDEAAYADQGSGDFDSDTQLTVGTDFYLDIDQNGISRGGRLVRIGTNWPSRRRTVKVVYTAGYTGAELDGTADNGIRAQAIRYAAILAVAGAFKTADTQGATDYGTGGAVTAESVTTTGHSVTYEGKANTTITGMQVRLPPEAVQMLEPYRRYIT